MKISHKQQAAQPRCGSARPVTVSRIQETVIAMRSPLNNVIISWKSHHKQQREMSPILLLKNLNLIKSLERKFQTTKLLS